MHDGGLVVDVGGGLGHVALEIAKAYPKLHIVIEDRPLVIAQAKPVSRPIYSRCHAHSLKQPVLGKEPSVPRCY